MDYSYLLGLAAASVPLIGILLKLLGGLVVAGLVVVGITPSQADDAKLAGIMAKPIIGPLLTAIAAFSPIQKK